MDDGSITLLAALIILVAFSAFFSASETAFSSLNQIRLKSRAEDGDSAAARVLAMSEKYDKLLSTILIGNNIVNIAAASIGTVLFTRLLDPERGATVSTFVLTIVVLIFGEVTPKSLAKEMPETVATAVSPFRVETLIAKAIIQGSYTEGATLTVDYDGTGLVLR